MAFLGVLEEEDLGGLLRWLYLHCWGRRFERKLRRLKIATGVLEEPLARNTGARWAASTSSSSLRGGEFPPAAPHSKADSWLARGWGLGVGMAEGEENRGADDFGRRESEVRCYHAFHGSGREQTG